MTPANVGLMKAKRYGQSVPIVPTNIIHQIYTDGIIPGNGRSLTARFAIYNIIHQPLHRRLCL